MVSTSEVGGYDVYIWITNKAGQGGADLIVVETATYHSGAVF